MSTIAAGTTSGTALVSTGNTDGTLVLQTNGTTTAVTIGTNQVVSLAQPLPVASGGTNSTATATAGGIGYGTGTAHAYTAAGTTNQVLVSNGASAPTWGSPSAPTAAQGASMVLVTSVTASSSSTVDVEDAMTDYDEYVILIDGVKPSDNASNLQLRLKIGGSYLTTSTYQSTISSQESGSTTITGTAYITTTAFLFTETNVTNASTQNLNGAVWITRPSSTSAYASLRFGFYYGSNNVAYPAKNVWGFGNNSTTGNAVTGIRFYFNSGTVSTGSFRLYGIKKS
jgi:hypothetical protein